ncbi:AAA family ATPase [Sinorhizobium medicae]|uniref:AAA ATPase central domain protein n=1 Tax=Sinorhizobium medicae (strain WSM419) TaxID=366394 RepID=A6U8S2_SINMW|nr:AAA family ATPase [Sinorhizobium medicae]ABR60052.1 AAA ATPase central domain protein [Sinorhizobium medicae WSM419]MDX0480557.1 AAA family ATPase [Sinorhizobium medicae]MDX0838030.1 AAA family ATPase [Sinorhizobium medicae]MDX0851372.1 AAA family ATPase [Sinorhizobium medicae]MDX0898651.1 AAA family ATPase [Sinorhizobium medicae]
MKSAKPDERKISLELTTYANSLRIALRRCGIFLKGDKAVGLLLPPQADLETYQQAVKSVLVGGGILHYAVPLVHVSAYKGETDADDAVKTVSRSNAVIVVIAHGADLPPELSVSLDRLEQVTAVKPYHLIAAARTVLDAVITRDQATALFSYPLPLMFAALRRSRPIEVTLEKLAASMDLQAVPEVKRAVAWEPRIEQLAGYGKATDWALDLVEDITAWRQGGVEWCDVDAGLLLSGPPGCGKTLFASAVARSCEASFFAVSSAVWQSHGHLGDMLRAMRKSFEQAIAAAPSILLIDEFDSFGSRKNLRGDGASYGLQVINALLEHLDGAVGREGVVVIAATNRPDDIDEALRRPGRLDRHIAVEMPDQEAREQILSAHAGVALPRDELKTIAVATSGYSGAALRQLTRDARRIARKARRSVCGSDFMSIVPPVAVLTHKERWQVCVHEAGHAIVGLALGTGDIEAIVVARQAAHRDDSVGHVEWRRPVVLNRTLWAYRNEIAMLLGGRAAEKEVLAEMYVGSGGVEGSDLNRAADIATILIAGHGVQGLGYTDVSRSRDLDQLRRTDVVLRRRVERLLAEELARAEDIVRERRGDVMRVAEALLEHEVLSGEGVAKLILGRRNSQF